MTKEDELIAINHVNRLYRYRRMDSKELEGIFINREIYLLNPTEFNDPFECRPNLIKHESSLSRELYIKNMAKRLRPNINKRYRERYFNEIRMILSDVERMNIVYENYIKEIGFYCLSAVCDDILMWGHYSKGHRGICLEFDTTKNVSLFDVAFKVSYNEEYPPLVDIINIGKSDEYRKALLTKSKHWEYEKEWRIIKPKDLGGPGKHKFLPELLTGVILGASISLEDKDKVLDWVRNYPTKLTLYQAKINRTKYQLEIEPI